MSELIIKDQQELFHRYHQWTGKQFIGPFKTVGLSRLITSEYNGPFPLSCIIKKTGVKVWIDCFNPETQEEIKTEKIEFSFPFEYRKFNLTCYHLTTQGKP